MPPESKFTSYALIDEQIKRVEKEIEKSKKELSTHESKVKRISRQVDELESTHSQLRDVQSVLRGVTVTPTAKIESMKSCENVDADLEEVEVYDRSTLRSGLRNLAVKRDEIINHQKLNKRKRQWTPGNDEDIGGGLGTPPATPMAPASKATQVPNNYLPECSIIVDNLKGHYVELRCDVCQVNCTRSNEFFKGWSGMWSHLISSHDTGDRAESETSFDYIMRTCVTRILDENEVEEVQVGIATITKFKEPLVQQDPEGKDEGSSRPAMLPYGPKLDVGPPLDEPEPVVEVPTWFHADGSGEHNRCSACDDQIRPGGSASICRFCGWGICKPCLIYRRNDAAHCGSTCINAMGDLAHFDIRQY